MRRLLAIAGKETLHIRRDARSLAAAIGLPVVLLLLYGYAVDFDLEELPFAVVDHDRSQSSRRLIEGSANIPSFRYIGEIDSAPQADRLFERRQARAVLVIPPGFERAIKAHRTAAVQILVDGSDATTGPVALNYTQGAVTRAAQALVQTEALALGVPLRTPTGSIDVRTRILYNPQLESRYGLVPGLIAAILMLLAALLTSGVVVRERERGSFELLAASPVSSGELIVGKLLPYLLLGAFDVVLSVAVGWAVFGVVPRGSLLLLFALSFVYILAALALGLLFSCLARTQQMAMMFAFVATVLPTMLLSGFAFPIRNMPAVLQPVSYVIPATHYVVIARSIVLKGVGLAFLFDEAAYLCLISLVLIVIAVATFRKRL